MDSTPNNQRAQVGWAVAITLALAALVVTAFGAFAGFTTLMARMDRTEDKIVRLEERIGRLETALAELPGKISQQLMESNRTILTAVMAAKTTAPDQQHAMPQPAQQFPDMPRRPELPGMAGGMPAGMPGPTGARIRAPPTPSWAVPGDPLGDPPPPPPSSNPPPNSNLK
ncbi:MAG: hypothetical protein QOI12_2875 [Alphaproteobacteria bacterium]|jgi:hypothetical protein|nr:hypothetical protein [Alphaproteobacteria bacterium]